MLTRPLSEQAQLIRRSLASRCTCPDGSTSRDPTFGRICSDPSCHCRSRASCPAGSRAPHSRGEGSNDRATRICSTGSSPCCKRECACTQPDPSACQPLPPMLAVCCPPGPACSNLGYPQPTERLHLPLDSLPSLPSLSSLPSLPSLHSLHSASICFATDADRGSRHWMHLAATLAFQLASSSRPHANPDRGCKSHVHPDFCC